MTALIAIETITAAKLFVPGGVQEIISKLESDVRAMPKGDATTEAGRKEIKSLAYKIARSKTALDGLGKEHVAELKRMADVIDADRRIIKDRLDALQEEVRKPVTDWEDAEKRRVEQHENALSAIRAAAVIGPAVTSAQIAERAQLVMTIAKRDWQEFANQGELAIKETTEALHTAMTAAVKREDEAAELARLRAEAAAREQKDREEQIAREAAAKATAEAEARAQADIARLEQERLAADARANAAVDRELERIAEEKRLAEVAARAREADTNHRRAVNLAAVAALVEGGMSEKAAKLAIALIAKRLIPAVTITY
jgi:colicin import membrane protein